MTILLRHLSTRRIAAISVGLLLALATREITASAPPTGFHEWPDAEQRLLRCLVSGSFATAFASWVYGALSPLRWLTPLAWDRSFNLALSIVVASVGHSAAFDVARVIAAAADTSPDHYANLLRWAAWIAAPPIIIGALPLIVVEVAEWIRTLDRLKSWLLRGRGQHASWIAPYKLRRDTHPLLANLR